MRLAALHHCPKAPPHGTKTTRGDLRDYADAGRSAGDDAGRQFKDTYSPGGRSAGFVHHFWPGLAHAIDSAMTTMAKSGATEQKVEAWRAGFVEAFEPFVIETAAALNVDDLMRRATRRVSPSGFGPKMC